MSGEIKKVGKKIVPTGWAPASRTVSTGKKLVTTAWSPTTVINKVKSFLQDPSTLGFRRIIDDWRKILCCGVGNNLTLLESTEFDNVSGSARPDGVILNPLVGFDLGPVAISDTSQGLMSWVWKISVTNGYVYIARENSTKDDWGSSIQWFVEPVAGITHIDFSFDQLGRPIIAIETAGEIWIHWYDPTIPGYGLRYISDGKTPLVYLDERRSIFNDISDVLIFFSHNNILYHALQRDRYEILYEMYTAPLGAVPYAELVFRATFRVYVLLTQYNENHNESTLCAYELIGVQSEPYPLYNAEGGQWLEGGVTGGLFKAPIYPLNIGYEGGTFVDGSASLGSFNQTFFLVELDSEIESGTFVDGGALVGMFGVAFILQEYNNGVESGEFVDGGALVGMFGVAFNLIEYLNWPHESGEFVSGGATGGYFNGTA